MGNRVPSLDIFLTRSLQSYQHLYEMGAYWSAGQTLYQINALLPSECKISDLPPLKLKGTAYDDIAYQGIDARNYCEEFAPLVFSAVGMFVETVVSKIIEENQFG